MSVKNDFELETYTTKRAIGFGFGKLADVTAIQTFTFLVFTFYYTIVGININLITIGFIIWSIWNAINDPIIGAISDRTHTRWGRRIPYIILSIIPLSVLMFLLFTPPIFMNSELANFLYFIIIIIAWEGIFTMFLVNEISLFPEVYLDDIERTKANNIRQIFSIVGLIMAFIIPTLFIPDLTNKKYLVNFQIIGIISGIIIFVSAILFLKIGAIEREEFKEDYKEAPRFFDSLKYSIKNKAFRWFIPAEMAIWFVFGMLPTMVPLYGKHVLNIGEGQSFLLGLLLGVTFISEVIFMNFWKFIVQKLGVKKSFIISLIVFILTLLPLLFINSIVLAFICFFFIGLGLSGPTYMADLMLADIIDADEISTKVRREAGYYGINALFMRLSVIFIFLSINLVFNSIGWRIYEPSNITPEIIFGLRALMALLPIVALIIAILTLIRYPLDKDTVLKMKEELRKIHEEKKSKL